MTKSMTQSNIPTRLEEFKDMKDGWLDSASLAPTKEGLDWLIMVCWGKNFGVNPETYPTHKGNVRMEWEGDGLNTKSNNIILTINLKNHTGKYFYFDALYDDVEEEKSLNLDGLKDWEWLIRQINEKIRDKSIPIKKE